jgi:hypothetical protein
MIEDALEVAADELAVKSIKRSAASNMMREAAVELRRLRGTIVHLEGDALADALLAEALESARTSMDGAGSEAVTQSGMRLYTKLKDWDDRRKADHPPIVLELKMRWGAKAYKRWLSQIHYLWKIPGFGTESDIMDYLHPAYVSMLGEAREEAPSTEVFQAEINRRLGAPNSPRGARPATARAMPDLFEKWATKKN